MMYNSIIKGKEVKVMESYEENGLAFVRQLLSENYLFRHARSLDGFERAVRAYNNSHDDKLRIAHGVSRFVIVCKDFVAKFDITKRTGWKIAGTNKDEVALYAFAEEQGYDYLFAKPTYIELESQSVLIMPRVTLDDEDSDLDYRYYISDEEEDWLYEHVSDIHNSNYGFDAGGNFLIIDYAWCNLD